MPNSPVPIWRTSSWTDGAGNCVEVADNLPDRVLVRDTKDRSGPVLTFDLVAWRSFVAFVKR